MTDMPRPTFATLPAGSLDALDGVTVAILGAAQGSPYDIGLSSHAAEAPAALRRASASFQVRQLDFDLGRPLLDADGGSGGIVDCGDIATDASDPEGNRSRIGDAVRAVLDAGAAPLVMGGDDSIPIPVFGAYAGRGPITILQVDAHVDWGDVIRGNPFGYGSPMRRAAAMPHVTGIVQVGIRGLGSGTPDQTDDARAWGSRIVTMRELRRIGIAGVIDLLPAGGDIFVTIDVDGLDLSIMPAVNAPTPGGLMYQDVIELLHGAAGKGRICGCTLVEFVPPKDLNGLAALTAARIVSTAAGLMRAGRP